MFKFTLQGMSSLSIHGIFLNYEVYCILQCYDTIAVWWVKLDLAFSPECGKVSRLQRVVTLKTIT